MLLIFKKFRGTLENLSQHSTVPRHTGWEPLQYTVNLVFNGLKYKE